MPHDFAPMLPRLKAQGVFVGSPADFRATKAFVEAHGLHPVIDP